METKDYIVAIDLGDSNIVVAVGSPDEEGRINIEHILTKPSEGVSAGQIFNIDLAIKTIKIALDELRDTTGITVKEAYAGISGEFVNCTSHTDHVYVPDHKNGVTQQVLNALFERMSNVLVAEDRIIMERIPQRYVINDTTEVDNPVGAFGSPLSSTFNFISSENIPLSRLDMALNRLGIKLRRTFANAVVVGDAVLTSDEKEDGVVVVDLGGELTDIAIYNRNILRYISTIPIGAKAINNDIRTLTISDRYVEPLKLKYGCAMSKNAPQDLTVIIKGRTKNEKRDVPVYNLAAVIEARVRDIAELVNREILDSGFADKVPYGIVITGGSAQLRSLDELFREVTGLDVRVAEAEEVISPQTRTKITSSADSTVVGLLIHGLKYGSCEVVLGKPTAVPAAARQIPTPPQESSVFQPPVNREPAVAARPITSSPIVQPPQPVVQPAPAVKSPVSGSVESVTAPTSINNAQRPIVPEPKAEYVAPKVESEQIEESQIEQDENLEAAPKRRHIFKWIDKIASKANKVVNDINEGFDVDDEV